MLLFRLYLGLAAAGAVLPYTLLVPWLSEHGFNLPLLLSQPFVNVPARIFVFDALFAAFVFLIFVGVESTRLRLRHGWAPILAVLVAGICCALPLFLAQREHALRRASSD